MWPQLNSLTLNLSPKGEGSNYLQGEMIKMYDQCLKKLVV